MPGREAPPLVQANHSTWLPVLRTGALRASFKTPLSEHCRTGPAFLGATGGISQQTQLTPLGRVSSQPAQRSAFACVPAHTGHTL